MCEVHPDCGADSVFDSVIEDQVDHVRAYFGMRKVSLGRVGNEKALRPLLNDKFVFHMGMLDQVSLLSVTLLSVTLSSVTLLSVTLLSVTLNLLN